jgi:hypothetical protein
VVGDAVNILSNNWNDAKSVNGLGDRVASNTTVNTAIVAGNVPSKAGGPYSGGIENFVRFHEKWDNKYFTVLGSFALLFNSARSRPALGSGRQLLCTESPMVLRSRPRRKNPPGFNVARYYERGRWMLRQP